jgi:hypothetical protein
MKTKQFSVCLRNDGYEVSLERRKIYQVLPDPEAAKHRQVRVIEAKDVQRLADRIAGELKWSPPGRALMLNQKSRSRRSQPDRLRTTQSTVDPTPNIIDPPFRMRTRGLVRFSTIHPSYNSWQVSASKTRI